MAIDTHNLVHANEISDIIMAQLGAVQENPERSTVLPPVMVWGAPGIGKSAIVKAAAEKMGLDFVDIRLAQQDSVDIRGVPKPNDETHQTEWYATDQFPTDNTKGGIIFLDELSAAQKDVQAASYELILDRQLGGGKIYKIPSKWIIVAAGNRSCDRAVSTAMSSALANRMMHFEIEADVEDWIAWATTHDIHPAVIGFIRFSPKTLHNMEDENLERGFPTPRSWERVSEMVKILKDETLLRKAVYGLVGTRAGNSFMSFYKLCSNLDDVLDMMTNPNRKVSIPDKDDVKWAITAAMVYHIWRGKTPEDMTARVGGFLRISNFLPPAFAMAAMNQAKMGNSKVSEREAKMAMMRHPEYKTWRAKFGKSVNDDYEV